MPNLFATIVLLAYPLFVVWAFWRFPPGRALLLVVVAGYLFLPPAPAAIKLPGLAPFTKDYWPALLAFAMVLLTRRQDLQLLPKNPVIRVAIFVYIFSPLLTLLTNLEPVVVGPVYLPGASLIEMISTPIQQAIVLLPFLLARHFLARPQDLRDLLIALIFGAAAYLIPILIELRLSPQLNTWIYGFFQHSFEQMMRDGGFRPIVFLFHALWVSFFTMTATLAAASLLRYGETRTRFIVLIFMLVMMATLVLSRTYASMFYAFTLVPVVLLFSTRGQLWVAMVFTIVALIYPTAKTMGWVPIDAILDLAGQMGPDRAQTLAFRFNNETTLIARAYENPLFGWGLWGRNHIYDAVDGKMLTVIDGRWILVLGTFGIVGWLAEMTLLATPIFLLLSRAGSIQRPEAWAGPIALILAVNLFDLIPNATLTPLTWLAAGAILGFLEQRQKVTAPSRSLAGAQIRTVL